MSDPNSPFDFIGQIVTGGVVNSVDLAHQLATILITAHHGMDGLTMQQPLITSDLGDYWLIEGSHNRDRTLEGHGSAVVKIRKSDGKILQLEIPAVLKVPPEVTDMIRAARKRSEK